MIVRELELDFFRNYTHLQARFDPKVNLIYGDNAQGKTNLLEAIAYLSTPKLFASFQIKRHYGERMVIADCKL